MLIDSPSPGSDPVLSGPALVQNLAFPTGGQQLENLLSSPLSTCQELFTLHVRDPFHPNYPPALKDKVGPRNLLHCFATDKDDPTEQPRWGKIGKQKIVDEEPLPPHPMEGIKYNLETVDDAIRDFAFAFMDKARKDSKPFFVWLNPTRMHVVTHLSPKYQKMRTPENGWSVEEAGMAQLDDVVGAVMKYLKDNGLDDNTIVAFSTDNGAENFTWPDGGQTPFAGGKGTAMEGGFRVPALVRWPGKVENSIISGLDWFPTFVAAAGYQGDIAADLRKGKKFGDPTYKVHLDGYNQMDLITGKGPSKRSEIFYFTETTLSAVRINDYKYRFTDQPNGWLGATEKVDWPILVNLRLDPFERTGMPTGKGGSLAYYNWFAYEFWRSVFVQQEVAKTAESFIEFPPMQKGASFNMEAVKEQVMRAIKAHQGHQSQPVAGAPGWGALLSQPGGFNHSKEKCSPEDRLYLSHRGRGGPDPGQPGFGPRKGPEPVALLERGAGKASHREFCPESYG
jgi:arylsulfatase